MVLRKTIFLFGICAVMRTSAQEQSKWKVMILKSPVLDEQGVKRISRQLTCFTDLHFCGYIKKNHCILLKYDQKKITDPSIITTTIHYLNNKINLSEVKGFNMYEIIDAALPE